MSAARPASSSASTPSSPSGSSSLWSFVTRFLDGTSLKDLALKLSSLKIPFLDSAQTSLVSAFLFFSILGAAFYVIDAFRNRFLRRTPLPGVDKDYSVYDYIVVGSGASGGALAARLAQYLPNASVLLMEAGGDDADEMLVSVPAAPMQLQRSAHDWSYRTVPQKDSHNTTQENRAVWPRGRILGGSSSINYMIVVRGVAADYDTWAKKYGCEGWGWQDCLPFFKNLESLDPNSFAINSNTSASRGLTGPVTISRHAQPSPHNAAFIKAAAAVTRTAVVDDYNRGDNSGFAHIQVNTRQGVRCNSSVAYIKPALQSLKNFSVATWSHVTRVLFNDKKEAVGVEFRRGKNVTELRQSSLYRIVARKEVILCGGAVNSPQILMLSGVGPADHLKQHKIPVIADVPGVGQNLRDHMASPMVYESRIPTLSLADQTAWNFIRWKLWGTGPFTSNMVESHGFISTGLRSNDDEMKGRPDVQILYGSGTFGADDFSNFGTKPEIVDLFRAMSKNISYTSFILPTLLHPESVGEIRLASNDPLQHPIIDPRYLSHPRDIATLVEACKISQNIMDRPEMKAVAGRFLSGELMPELVQKFDRYKDPNSYFDGHIRNQCGTLYHPVGTCRMGPLSDVNTVCSPDLRVKGVKKLRVADASIMPTLMSGNTNIPCMMIGERAAFIIAQQAKVATSAAPSKAQSAATPTGKAKL